MQYDRTSDSPPEEDHDLMLVCFVTWRNLLDHFGFGGDAGTGLFDNFCNDSPFGPVTLLNSLPTGYFLLTQVQFDLIDVNRRSSLSKKRLNCITISDQTLHLRQ